MNTRASVVGMACLAMAVIATGCLERELKPLNPCLVSGVSRKVAVNNVDKVDLLFMIDNSNSMAAEQAALRAQFPKLINVLTTGMRTPDDMNPFPPAKDLHVGVVSSDMGIPGVNFGSGTGCSPDGGDDGKLQHTAHPGPGLTCAPTPYPAFLSYSMMQNTDKAMFANDFACIANLGTGGCGFESQLEAPLKALWPSTFIDRSGNVVAPNPITFLATTVQGTMGRGDLPAAQGGNMGFLRNDVNTGLSLIAIIIVTDEEDCSSKITDHLKPTTQLDMNSPYYKQDINLRCFYNKDLLYNVQQRYLRGFRLLRDGNEQLVVFAAITGVPPDLVDKKTLEQYDFSNEARRNQFYAQILGDPRMQEEIDPATNPGMGTGNLKPSCARTDKNGELATATPPRRIVELAQGFGENGIVQSICQDDFGPAMDAIINIIAKQLGAVCLPRPLVRKADGKVGCNVVWELPKPGTAPMTTPTVCNEDWLTTPKNGRATTNDRQGNNCVVAQLPVTKDKMDGLLPPDGKGWYYDNYTKELMQNCNASQPQRVAFTADAKPPTGVIVKLECLNETQTLPNTRADVVISTKQPEIGTPCGEDVTGGGAISGNAACIITLNDGKQDAMFCHPDLKVCVRPCQSDTQCPAAWVCDKRDATVAATKGMGPYCVNPTCGADTEMME